MKKLILGLRKKLTIIGLFLLITSTAKAGIATNNSATVTTNGTSCHCQAGQTICSATALFMSCCTCCQPGSSCGAWSAFGLCACKCENTNSSMVINPVTFEDFLNWADLQGISTSELRTELLTLIPQNSINSLRNGGQDINIANSAINNFAENCKAIIESFSSAQKSLINSYTN